MKPDDQALTELLLQAVKSPHGVKVTTNDTNRLRADLYKIRKRDELFKNLTFTISTANQLCIVKKSENENAPPEE